MELNGTVKLVMKEEVVSDRFKKRGLVLTTQEQYPQDIMIEFVQDKTDLLNGFNEGESVTVSINIRGREWKSPQGETKYFTSIQGWRIQRQEAASPGVSAPYTPPTQPGGGGEDTNDDLPF